MSLSWVKKWRKRIATAPDDQCVLRGRSRVPLHHTLPADWPHIAPIFWDYWCTPGLGLGESEREALALWGYPLTALIDEHLPGGYTIKLQWYERARFEHHPKNWPPYNIMLRRLAADTLEGMLE